MNLKHIVLAVLLATTSLLGAAQNEEQPEGSGFQKDRLFVGGNFGLTFGNFTLINLSPQVGYRFTRAVSAGIGINGQYISLKQFDGNGNDFRRTSQGVVGLNIFGRLYPIEQFMIQVQPEANYVFGKEKFFNPAQEFKLDAVIVPSLLLGGGLVLPSGGGNLIISVFYDALQKERSPYGNRPIYNIGYNINLGR